MSRNELQKSLGELRAELDGLDAQRHARVEHLLNDLEHQLENPDDAEHRATLVESLRSHKEQFEVEHPGITGIINQIMMTLSNMGI